MYQIAISEAVREPFIPDISSLIESRKFAESEDSELA